MSGDDLVARARQELDAARLLADGGFHAQAVSRSYYAAFYAAEAALLDVGQTRSRHAGVIAAFAQFIVKDGGVDPAIGRLLRSLFDRRAQADYSTDPVPRQVVDAALADATAILDAIDVWRRRGSSI